MRWLRFLCCYVRRAPFVVADAPFVVAHRLLLPLRVRSLRGYRTTGTSAYRRSETVRKIIIYLEALPSAPLSFSTLCHFAPALDPLPVSDNLELVF